MGKTTGAQEFKVSRKRLGGGQFHYYVTVGGATKDFRGPDMTISSAISRAGFDGMRTPRRSDEQISRDAERRDPNLVHDPEWFHTSAAERRRKEELTEQFQKVWKK